MPANTDHTLDSTFAPATNAAGLASPSSAPGSATVGSGGELLGGIAGTGSTQAGSIASKVGVYATAHAQAQRTKYEFVCERKSDGRKPHAEAGFEKEDVVAVYYHKKDPQKQEFEVVPKAAHLNDPKKAMDDVNQRFRHFNRSIAGDAQRAATFHGAQAQAQNASAAAAVQQTSAHQQQMDTDIKALAGQAAALQAGIAQLQAPLQQAVTSNQDAASHISAQQPTLGQLQVDVQTAAAAHQAADDAAAAPTSAVPATLTSAGTCMSSGLPDLGGAKKGAAVSGGMSQPSTTGNAELGRLVTDARQMRQGTGKGKGIVSSSTSKGSNIHTLADLPGSESEDDAPPKKKAKRAAPKKRDATQSEVDLKKLPWDLVSKFSSHQGCDDAVMAEVLAPTLNDDEEKAEPDADFVPDSKLTATTAKPDRHTRSTGPAVPTSKDQWSCFKCMKKNPPKRAMCSGKTCDGKRNEGTIIAASIAQQPATTPVSGAGAPVKKPSSLAASVAQDLAGMSPNDVAGFEKRLYVACKHLCVDMHALDATLQNAPDVNSKIPILVQELVLAGKHQKAVTGKKRAREQAAQQPPMVSIM